MFVFGAFFIDVEDFTSVSGVTWVDVIDTNYTVVTSGTYFYVDGNKVAVTFSGIANGYRMYYNRPYDFVASGTVTYTAHAENSNGDIIEQDYELLYGYDVSYNGSDDWGFNNEVVIWAGVNNEVLCPNYETEAYYFTTRDLFSYGLTAVIMPVKPLCLQAEIYPQNTFYFYGRTYTVTISGVTDFHNNVMEPYTFSFTIQDPTSSG